MVVIPGNHDSRNVGYVHFEDLFGERNSVLNVGRTTIVAVDSSEPDLDNGQVGRGRYRMIEEAFAGAPDLRIFVLHHHLLPVPGTGRERNIVNDAGDTLETLQRAEVDLVLAGPQARPVRVAARGSLRGQRRHGLVLAAARQGKALLQRRRGRRARTWTSGAAIPFHEQERIIQFSTDTKTYEKYTTRIEDEVRST
jgi:3',5'-cyclic AMP phosphodiesterase CpdA